MVLGWTRSYSDSSFTVITRSGLDFGCPATSLALQRYLGPQRIDGLTLRRSCFPRLLLERHDLGREAWAVTSTDAPI
jgi:hypothetical protein